MKRFLILLFALFVSGLVQAQDQVKLFSDKSQSFLKYYMNHPLHSWVGECTDFTSVILTNEDRSSISQVAVSAKISSFDSKNANRDSHTMEVTEAIKYPTVTFSSKSVTKIEDGKIGVQGILAFHGVSKPISFEAEVKHKGKSLEVSGSFIVLMTDYKIERPSLMGMTADDEIKIEFKTVF